MIEFIIRPTLKIDFMYPSPNRSYQPQSRLHHLLIIAKVGYLLSLHEPDAGQSGIFGPGMRDRFIKSFRVKSLLTKSPQIIGSESACRPQNPQRPVISLILIRLVAGVHTRACFRQIYQDSSHNSHPIFNRPSDSALLRYQVMIGR
jgi:hypothetical protein